MKHVGPFPNKPLRSRIFLKICQRYLSPPNKLNCRLKGYFKLGCLLVRHGQREGLWWVTYCELGGAWFWLVVIDASDSVNLP